MVFQIILIQIITFAGLVVMLRFLFYRQLNTALGRLRALHEENIAREEELKKELERIKKEKEDELSKAKRDSARLINESKDRAIKIGADMQMEAKAQAGSILERANEESKRMERDLQSMAEAQAIDLSLMAFKLIFTQQSGEALQRELISELIGEIEKVPENRFTVKEHVIKVSSAFALTKEEKARLLKILAVKTGQADIELRETANADIIAGLIIQIGALTIDGSLRSKLKKAIAHLNEK
jgi:F0F1-type ATP synthase membrane subunit b/b'